MAFARALPVVLLAACASAPAPASYVVNAPALRAALPPQAVVAGDSDCPPGRCGTTGRDARITYNPRASAVAALYERYLRALYDHSIDGLRPLLADFVAPLQEGANPAPNAGYPRESALTAHQRLFQSIDTGNRAFASLYAPPRVHAGGGTGAPSWLRPRDYFATGDTSAFRRAQGFTQMNLGMPTQLGLLVRFIDDEPRIVGISRSITQLNP